MAKGIWISDEERERIVQMRKDGVPVAAISKQTERSTNFIYRILRKINGPVPSKKAATVSDTSLAIAAPPAAGGNEGRDRLLEELSDSSAALLCAVESMEVSPYEPIPMPRSVRSSEQLHTQLQQARPDTVNTSVGFTGAPATPSVAKPQSAEPTDEFWLLTDTTPSTGRVASTSMAQDASSDTSGCNQVQTQLSLQTQPSKKQKTSTSTSQVPAQTTNAQPPSAPTSSSLLVNIQFQRPRTPRNTATNSTERLGGLLKRLQDEIRRLEGLPQSDIYDAQLLQMLVKFHAEVLLMQLHKTLSDAESSKRARDEDSDGKETSRLLRQKLAKEIALLNVQADRERLELEREQIRHKTTSMICRKTLLDANTSQADVDQLFSHQ